MASSEDTLRRLGIAYCRQIERLLLTGLPSKMDPQERALLGDLFRCIMKCGFDLNHLGAFRGEGETSPQPLRALLN